MAGLAASFGSGAMTNDIAGIKNADVILVIGSDTTSAHPVIAARIKQAVRFGKTKLIVIDPKKIRLADYATIYAAQRCGTDVAVLNGIMHVIIKNNWHDAAYVEERCEGFEDLKKEVEKYTPEYVEKISGIPAAQIEEIAELFGKAPTAGLFYAMGITQHTTGVDNVWSTANLQMLCGNLGKSGGGVNPLRGQSNVQGACDMGGLPNVFPAYQKVDDPAIREKFEKAWKVKLPEKPGLTVTTMIEAAHAGKIKAFYIMGENPMISDPDLTHAEESLKNVDFIVVQDMFLTETAAIADVVLPATSYAEKEGTFTNTERRVQLIKKAVDAPAGTRHDWEILKDLAGRDGRGGLELFPLRGHSRRGRHPGPVLRRHHIRAARTRRPPLAVPDEGAPGNAGSAYRQVLARQGPHEGDSLQGAGRASGRRVSAHHELRARPRAVPHGNDDAQNRGAQQARRPDGHDVGRGRRNPRHSQQRAGEGHDKARLDRDGRLRDEADRQGNDISPVPLRRGSGEQADDSRARPGGEDPRVQGVRGEDR